MARYRKIDVRIWNDRAFGAFSDDAKLAFLFLLTHPNLTSLGAMRATRAGLAEELGWSLPRFTRAFSAILTAGMAEHDPRAAFLWLPNFFRYNPAENGNVVKGWIKAFDLLPECPLRERLLVSARLHCEGSLINGVAEAARQVFGEGSPLPFPPPSGNRRGNQEQEQDLEPDRRTTTPPFEGDHARGDVVSSTATTANRGGTEQLAVLELVALWNRLRTTANTVAMPMGPKAYQPLVAAVRRRSLDAWEATFSRVEASDYLAGRAGLPGLTLWDAVDRAELIDSGKYDTRTAPVVTPAPATPKRSRYDIDVDAMAASIRASLDRDGRSA